MNPYPKRTVSGFTLVELLIVVIILAILAAIVVPQFASSTGDAKDGALQSTLSGMRAAIDLYYQQHNNTYPGVAPSTDAGSRCSAISGTAGSGNASDSTGKKQAFIDQLGYYSDKDGHTCSKKADSNGNVLFPYGPYLKKHVLPINPVTSKSDLNVISKGDLEMVADGASGGWKFDTITGKFIANDSNQGSEGKSYSSY